MIDAKVHLDSWLGEFELHQPRLFEESTLLLDKLLAFRLRVKSLLELLQLLFELLGVRKHIECLFVILNFLSYTLFGFADVIVRLHHDQAIHPLC